jgi:hypothetical protein
LFLSFQPAVRLNLPLYLSFGGTQCQWKTGSSKAVLRQVPQAQQWPQKFLPEE